MTKIVSSTSHVDLLQTDHGFMHYQRVTYDQRASVALALLKIMIKEAVRGDELHQSRQLSQGDLNKIAESAVATTVAFYDALDKAGLAVHTPPPETLEAIAKEGLLNGTPTDVRN